MDAPDAVLGGPDGEPEHAGAAAAGGLSFGDYLRQLRSARHLTQEALAGLTGLSVRTLRYLESGRIRQPRWNTVRRLSDGLELTPRERQALRAALLRTALPGAAAGTPAYPTWLPPGAPFFVGRAEQLRELDRLISPESPPAFAAVISGAAGIGKTALAGYWAQRSSKAFPDGQLYINLRGFDPAGPPLPPPDAIRAFLNALGVPLQRIPGGLTEQVGLYRTLTTGKRILVVLDNARDAEQVRLLLPAGARSRAVITSRSPLVGLVATEAALPVVLDILSPAEAREFLRRRLGHDRIDRHGAAVDDILARCARLPLALALVAARAAAHRHDTLHHIAEELRRAADALDVIVSDEAVSDLRTVFSWSYRSLTHQPARAFRLLGLHPGPDISLDAAASLLGVAASGARSLLAQLAGVGLVSGPAPGRYLMHDLLRAYAAELAELEPPEQRRAATARVLDHYLATVISADRRLQPLRDSIDIAPARESVTVTAVPDRQAALSWLNAEHPVLARMVSVAAAAGFDTHVWQLAWGLVEYFDLLGYPAKIEGTQRIALAAAERLGNREAEGRALRYLANADLQTGNLDGADQHLRQALRVFAACGDAAGQANAHLNLALLRERQERFGEANDHARQALSRYREAGHRVGEGAALNSLGYGYALAGDLQRALQCCMEALAVNSEIGDQKGKAHTLDSLGYIHAQLREFDTAAGYYGDALALFRDIGDRYNEADALINLGDVAGDRGDGPAATASWQEAIVILDELEDPRVSQVRERLKTGLADQPGLVRSASRPGP